MFFVFKGHLSPFWRLCGGTQDEPTDQDTVPPLIVRIGWILLGRTVSFVLFQVLHGVVNRWTEMRMLDDCADDYLVLIYQEEVRMQNSLETFNWEFDLSLAVETVRWNDKEKKKHFPNIRNEVTLILDDSILPVTETYFFIISVCTFLMGNWKSCQAWRWQFSEELDEGQETQISQLLISFSCMLSEDRVPMLKIGNVARESQYELILCKVLY